MNNLLTSIYFNFEKHYAYDTLKNDFKQFNFIKKSVQNICFQKDSVRKINVYILNG